MKKLISCVFAATVALSLSSIANAKNLAPKGQHHEDKTVTGKVIKADDTSITIKEGKAQRDQTLTFSIPKGTPVKGGTLSDIVGKVVKIVEQGPSTAKEIIVETGKH